MTSFRLTVLIGGATSLTRILGFIRDVLLAALFGAGPVADSFFIALRIPNLARRLMGEGGWTGAYVPVATKIINAGDHSRERSLIRDSLFFVTLLTAILVITGEIFAHEIIEILAPGLSADRHELSVIYFRALLPLISGATLTSLLSAILNSQKKFMLQAVVPVIVNAALVSLLIYFNQFDSLEHSKMGLILAWAASIATFIQVMILACPLSFQFENGKMLKSGKSADLWSMIRMALPNFIIQFGGQFGILILLNFGSNFPAAISHLTYAERLAQLPYGFIATGLSTVALPEFASLLLNKDRQSLHQSIDRIFFLAIALVIPASLALIILAEPIVSVLFERGAFGEADRIGTAMALVGFAVGLPFAAIARVQTQLYFAHERVRVPLLAVALSTLLILSLVQLPLFSQNTLGLALSFSLGQMFLCAAQQIGLQSLSGWSANRAFWAKFFKVILASGLMALALFIANRNFGSNLIIEQVAFTRWVGLGIFCASGFGLYAVMIYFFGLWRHFR